LNNTIGNLTIDTNAVGSNFGQSFINDPLGTGETIKLNTWTASFLFGGSREAAAAATLTIRNGVGNAGSVVGTSSSATTGTIGGQSVTWTFAGGLNLIDTSTYTAVLAPSLGYRLSNNRYANGALTNNTARIVTLDTSFEATFSAATPVPFEFSPALGLVGLGVLWSGKKFLSKK